LAGGGNNRLGRFDLAGHPGRGPRAVPKSKYLDIDANGHSSASPAGKAPARSSSIRIQASRRLSTIQFNDARGHAAEKRSGGDLWKPKNQADALIHSTEKAMSEHGDRWVRMKTAIEAAIASSKDAGQGRRCRGHKGKTNTLAQAR